MAVTIQHDKGTVTIAPLPSGKSRVTVALHDPQAVTPLATCDTSYPTALIEHLAQVKGPAYLCQEIVREEDPREIQRQLRHDVLSYVDAAALAGKRVLDFACGCGASSIALLKLSPAAEMVGVDLRADCVAAARERAAYYGYRKTAFHHSPDSRTLPADLGTFDYILLSAVYEHLLPDERRTLLPQLWNCLNDGGVLFLNQTPYRYFPMELHTTKLPLVNYLPDGLALQVARRWSRRVRRDESWESLLRRGIRGASVGEILGNLPRGAGRPAVLAPQVDGIRDQIDLWYVWRTEAEPSRARDGARVIMKALKRITGVELAPDLTIAIRKVAA